MAQLTLRIYKDEVSENRLQFICRAFTICEETERVITVEGSEEDIVKLYDNCLLSDERFKAAFPDYMTRAERIEYTREKCESIKAYFRDTLLEITANGELNEDYAMLRQIYLQYLK